VPVDPELRALQASARVIEPATVEAAVT